MRFKIKVYLILMLLSHNALSAIPTVEGLFRNGNNQNLTGNFAVINLSIEEMTNESALKKITVGEKEEKVHEIIMNEDKTPPQHLRFLFSLANEHYPGMIQLEYESKPMNRSSFRRSMLIPNLLARIASDSDLDRALFHSILMMLSLNDSRGMATVMKKVNPEFKSNREVMNKEKVRLYEKYKRYLMRIKEDPSLKGELVSPLRPKDENERRRVNEIMNLPIYSESDYVKLVQENDNFFWKVDMENIQALFANETHRLVKLSIQTDTGRIEVSCGDYILFNGIHELPKLIIFKSRSEKVFHIKIAKCQNFDSKKKTIFKRAQEYKKLEEKAAKANKAPMISTKPYPKLFTY